MASNLATELAAQTPYANLIITIIRTKASRVWCSNYFPANGCRMHACTQTYYNVVILMLERSGNIARPWSWHSCIRKRQGKVCYNSFHAVFHDLPRGGFDGTPVTRCCLCRTRAWIMQRTGDCRAHSFMEMPHTFVKHQIKCAFFGSVSLKAVQQLQQHIFIMVMRNSMLFFNIKKHVFILMHCLKSLAL